MMFRAVVWAMVAASIVLLAGSSRADAVASVATPPTPAPIGGVRPSVPVLAYYYIWFEPSSWDRAKIDLPALGKYSSDDPSVMRKHIEWAKQAGITGFIVSWKDTPVLDRRLSTLIDVATSEHFSLAIVYEGLDFSRNPLPASTVAHDLALFARTYASREPFRIFAKPLVVWSGTWKFSTADVASAVAPVRNTLTVLASERSASEYERLANVVDGDAYYWSSVNPDTYPSYKQKLADMATAVHDHHGIWIPPAAAGFDARAIGGTTIVPRADGSTLLRECSAAYGSSPDAIGLISWNEFSENSYIEPSRTYGTRYIGVAAQCTSPTAGLPAVGGSGSDSADSSSPGRGVRSGLVAAPLMLLILGALVFVVARRGRRGAK